MSMANSVRIKYHGETLCCLDQTEVKAVEPYVFKKFRPQNVFRRAAVWIHTFITGKPSDKSEVDHEEWTKVSFKDGTWIRLKMPFLEFVNGYC